MEVAQHFKSRTLKPDIDDLACDFMEQSVGRHDWRNNWPKFKEKHPELKQYVKAWLDRFEIDHDPQGLIDFLDRMAVTRSGRWR